MDPLSITASVLTLISVVKTCMDAYEIIDDARHAYEDVKQLVSNLYIERVRFFYWCQYVGITEVIRLQQLKTLQQELDSSDIMLLTPSLRKTAILRSIQSTMESIIVTFKSSKSLLENYTGQSSNHSFVTKVLRRSTNLAGSMALADVLWAEEKDRQKKQASPKLNRILFDGTKGPLKAAKWAMMDKKKFTALVIQLRNHNNGLTDVLEAGQKVRLQREEDLLATTTPFLATVYNSSMGQPAVGGSFLTGQHSSDTNDIRSLRHAANSDLVYSDRNARLLQLVELHQRGKVIEEDSGSNTNDALAISTSQITLTTPQYPTQAPFIDDLHLLTSSITIPLGENSTRQRRLHTYYNKDKPVIVEWKYYSLRISPDLLNALQRRVSLLTQQLKQSSESSDFSILPCIGHFEDPSTSRIGIVFSYPFSNQTLQPISLQDRLIQDRSQRKIRDLASRFAIAKALALSFYRLHSVGWLHKSFRSDNVLFFEPPDQDPYDLAPPFVCGFDFSRQDTPAEMTEDVPTVLLSQSTDRERAFYKHPDLDRRQPIEPPTKDDSEETVNAKVKAAEALSREFRYRKAYDIYSLGIVLLEIGMWKPVKDMGPSTQSVADWRHRLHDRLLVELRSRMGKKYFEVVERCLNGTFGAVSVPADIGTSTQMNHDAEATELKATRRWLEAFLKEAVNVLEDCLV
ncbi:hypothetical protein MMC11_004447 [Xylographa trunciseda]|nr:hypothetical protein [Xylographa trunciseda]